MVIFFLNSADELNFTLPQQQPTAYSVFTLCMLKTEISVNEPPKNNKPQTQTKKSTEKLHQLLTFY